MSERPSQIPVLRRTLDAVPRRSATDTWRSIADFLSDLFSSHVLAEHLEIVLLEMTHHAQLLLMLQELTRVEVVGGEVLCIAVDVVYGSTEGNDDLELPLVPIAEIGGFDSLEITLLVRDRLQGVREVIDLMGYRAPEGISVQLRNDSAHDEQRELSPISDPIQV